MLSLRITPYSGSSKMAAGQGLPFSVMGRLLLVNISSHRHSDSLEVHLLAYASTDGMPADPRMMPFLSYQGWRDSA